MLKTAGKQRLAKGLSYPMGAGMISAALEAVPQYEEMQIHFVNFNIGTGSPSKLREMVKSGESIHILSASHSIRFPSVYYSGKDEWWGIWVYALPREYRQEAQHSLLEAGLPKVREWLSRKRMPTEEKPAERLIVEMSFAPRNVIVRSSDDLF